MLSRPAEVLLSYLTGLGPVGTNIEVRRADLLADLGYRQKNSFYRILNEVIAAGCVAKLACGSVGSTDLLVVKKRLEDLAERQPIKVAVVAESASEGRVFYSRAAQDRPDTVPKVPKDTRGLTAKYFGDPIFVRSALGRKLAGAE